MLVPDTWQVLGTYSRINPIEPVTLIWSKPELLVLRYIPGAGSVLLGTFSAVGKDSLVGCEVNLVYGDEHFKQMK